MNLFRLITWRTNVPSLVAEVSNGPTASLTNCKQLTDYFNGHHGYYSASGWSMSGASELVGWGSCHVRVANMDNANTIK